MGDFNINILSCFIDTIYSNSFYPTVNIPTRIKSTSKTLIDNILYNNVTRSISAGNIATSISYHLTQFIFIPSEIYDRPTTKKVFRRKHTAENLKKIQIALDKIDWRRTLLLVIEIQKSQFKSFGKQ